MEEDSETSDSSDSEEFEVAEDAEDVEEEENREWKQELRFTNYKTPIVKEDARLKKNLKWEKPIDSFSEFLSDYVLEKFKNESNEYGRKKLKNFKETTTEEWKYFFTIVITLSLHSFKGDLAEIWSTKWQTRMNGITERFGRNRFMEMKSALHLVNNSQFSEEIRKRKRAYKIQWFLDYVSSKAAELRTPPKFLSLDEGTAPYKGSRSVMRQYNPDKQHKYGFKFWMLCDKDGYVYNMNIYQGAIVDESGNKVRTVGLAKKVVLALTIDLPKGHILIVDNYYSSIALAQELLKKGIYFLGQIKKNATGLDKNWVAINYTGQNKLLKSEWDWQIIENIVAFIWHDTKINMMISTYPKLVKNKKSPFVSTIERRNKGEIETRTCPTAANLYNEQMGGVDLFGSHRGRSPTGLKSKKYWHIIFWYCFDVAIVCSWLNWNFYKSTDMYLYDFKISITSSWEPPINWRKISKSITPKKRNAREISSSHTPIMDSKSDNCVICLENNRDKKIPNNLQSKK